MLFLRSLIAAVLLPGTVTILVPWLVLRRTGLTPAHWAGLVPSGLGAGILFRCIWEFAVAGRGTLAPVDPPRSLVVSGLYRYVRNPMYVGVVLFMNLFILFHEEPALLRKFEASYEDYMREVPRWMPRIRGR